MIYIACVHFRLAKAPSSIAAIQLYRDGHVVIQVLIQQPAGRYSQMLLILIVLYLVRSSAHRARSTSSVN